MSEPPLPHFRPRRRAGQAQGRHSHQKPPSGQRAPPSRYQARFTGSRGSCPWNWKLSLPPRGPRDVPWTTHPRMSPTPTEAQLQGSTRELRPGWGAGHGSVPGGAGPGGPDPRQQTGSSVGSLVCTPHGRIRALHWLKVPQPAPRRQTWTHRLQLSKVCAEPPRKGA